LRVYGNLLSNKGLDLYAFVFKLHEFQVFCIHLLKIYSYRTNTFLARMGLFDLTKTQIGNLRVCHDHFQMDMFDFDSKQVKLRECAVPFDKSLGLKYPAGIEVNLIIHSFKSEKMILCILM